MPHGARTNRRRQWLVDPPLQTRFTRTLILIVCALAVAALVGLYLSLAVIVATFDLQRDEVIVQLFRNVGLLTAMELLVCLPVLIWLLVWVGIRWTHSIAGPLVRINRALRDISRGNFDTQISLRKGDSLTELAESVNELAAFLRRNRS